YRRDQSEPAEDEWESENRREDDDERAGGERLKRGAQVWLPTSPDEGNEGQREDDSAQQHRHGAGPKLSERTEPIGLRNEHRAAAKGHENQPGKMILSQS